MIWQALRAPLAISPLRSWGRTPMESLWISGPVVSPTKQKQNNGRMSCWMMFYWHSRLSSWLVWWEFHLSIFPLPFSHWAKCSGLIGPQRRSKTLEASAAISLSHTCLIKRHIECLIHEILGGLVCCLNSAFSLSILTKQTANVSIGHVVRLVCCLLSVAWIQLSVSQGWLSSLTSTVVRNLRL